MGALEKDTGDKGQDERESGGAHERIEQSSPGSRERYGEKDERERERVRAYGSGCAA